LTVNGDWGVAVPIANLPELSTRTLSLPFVPSAKVFAAGENIDAPVPTTYP
jgi:hypothetical protein